MTTPATDKDSLQGVIEAFQLFRSLDPLIPIGALRAFLLIALEQGQSVTDLKMRSDSALSSASRHHHYLGDMDRHGRPGLGLIKAPRSYADVRKKSLRLTPKGRRVMGQLAAALKPPP